MTPENIELEVGKETQNVLEERGLEKGEVEGVIENAESTGEKLRDEAGEKFLAKTVNENLTTYAIYEAERESAKQGGKFNLLSAYAHKMTLEGVTEGSEAKEESEWFCNKCDEKAVQGNVDLSYLGVTRPAPSIICPECNDSYMSEEMATKTLPAAEQTLEEKRA